MPHAQPAADSPTSPQAPAPRTPSVWKKLFKRRRQHGVIRFLNELHERLLASQHPAVNLQRTWLVPFRPQFRHAIQNEAAPALRYYLASCPPEMTPLAVWLLGRCADSCRLYDLPDFARDASPVVRRHAARALRRLEAWSQLEDVARLFPNDRRLQWYAYATIIKRPHSERLRSFTQFVDASNAAAAAGPSRMPLWFGDLDWIRRPPKSGAYIRRLLMHIHRLVHGGRV
jgi:hypothetical protein